MEGNVRFVSRTPYPFRDGHYGVRLQNSVLVMSRFRGIVWMRSSLDSAFIWTRKSSSQVHGDPDISNTGSVGKLHGSEVSSELVVLGSQDLNAIFLWDNTSRVVHSILMVSNVHHVINQSPSSYVVLCVLAIPPCTCCFRSSLNSRLQCCCFQVSDG